MKGSSGVLKIIKVPQMEQELQPQRSIQSIMRHLDLRDAFCKDHQFRRIWHQIDNTYFWSGKSQLDIFKVRISEK